MEGQITFDEYLASITTDTQLENEHLKQAFLLTLSYFPGPNAGLGFYKDPAFEVRFYCDYDKGACSL